MHTAAHEPEPTVYAVAVACHLLRFASYEASGPPDDWRALAYALASGLVAAAAAALGAGGPEDADAR